jgi:hypothetical protein
VELFHPQWVREEINLRPGPDEGRIRRRRRGHRRQRGRTTAEPCEVRAGGGGNREESVGGPGRYLGWLGSGRVRKILRF